MRTRYRRELDKFLHVRKKCSLAMRKSAKCGRGGLTGGYGVDVGGGRLLGLGSGGEGGGGGRGRARGGHRGPAEARAHAHALVHAYDGSVRLPRPRRLLHLLKFLDKLPRREGGVRGRSIDAHHTQPRPLQEAGLRKNRSQLRERD